MGKNLCALQDVTRDGNVESLGSLKGEYTLTSKTKRTLE